MIGRRLLFGLSAASLLALGACEATQPSARLDIVLPARDVAGAELLPWADQPVFAVTVTAPDLAAASPVTGLPGQTVSIEVAAGSARRIEVSLYPAAGITLATHAGSAGPFDLAPGERRAETVDLWLLPLPVATPLPFTRIAAGEAVTCGITSDGSGWCWGWNAGRAITPDGADVAVTAPSPIPVDEKIRAIAVGSSEVCAVGATSGAVHCFGQTTLQQSSGLRTIANLPIADPALEVAVGALRACAVHASGKVRCWGTATESCWGECAPSLEATFEVTGIAAAVAIDSAGSVDRNSGQTFCARGNAGQVWCWGDNSRAQAGEPDIYTYPFIDTPIAISIPGGATAIGVGLVHACAVDGEGVLYCWGGNGSSQIQPQGPYEVTEPTAVSLPGSVTALSVAGLTTCAQVSGGAVYCLGSGLPPYDADGWSAEPTEPVAIAGAAGARPVVGDRHLCVLDSAGGVKCIGRGREGQSGDNPNRVRSVPARVGSDVGWTQVRVQDSDWGAPTGCAVRGGRLFCWGENSDGQLGVGLDYDDLAYSWSPLEVGGSDWAQLGGHGYLNCGRRTDGSVWCWGYGNQLGMVTEPVQQGTLTGAVHFDVGPPETLCAAKPDGLYCWGDLYYSVPGFSNMGSTWYSPVMVTSTSYTQIAVGYQFACAAKGDASLECWGDNTSGQVGNGTLGGGPWAPTPVGNGGWAQVVAGYSRVCARKAAGQVYCWGNNWDQTLGLPQDAPAEISTPTLVPGLPLPAIDITLSSNGLCALLSDHTTRCTGRAYGSWGPFTIAPLGVGADWSATTMEPALVGRTWSQVRLGVEGGASCGIQTDGSLWCWGNPERGALGLGTMDHNAWRPIDQPVVLVGP